MLGCSRASEHKCLDAPQATNYYYLPGLPPDGEPWPKLISYLFSYSIPSQLLAPRASQHLNLPRHLDAGDEDDFVNKEAFENINEGLV